MDDKAIIAAQRRAYGDNFRIHGNSPKGTFQNDEVTQYIRFAQLIRNLSPHFASGDAVHDVGSGVCDFYAFLKKEGLDSVVQYSGTEIVQDMVDAVRKSYPELQIHNRNLLADNIIDRYDFCVLSGTFNIPGGTGEADWKDMCFALIERMFSMSRKGISFNMLTSYNTFSKADLCYFDPKEMFDFATRRLSRFVILDAAAPLYEFTVTVLRDEYAASINSDPRLKKYFKPAA